MTLSIVFTMLDFGLLVFQSNMLSLSARRLARESIVRGATIDPSSTWGPAAVSGNAGDGTPVASVIRPYCVTMPPSRVAIRVTWPDGTNDIGDRVTTRLSFQRDPLTPFTSWIGPVHLNASATMAIIH